MLWPYESQQTFCGINTTDTKVGQISPFVSQNDPIQLGKLL